MSVIPDPQDSERRAIDSDGRLLNGVWATPLDEDGEPAGERRHIGYVHRVVIEESPAS